VKILHTSDWHLGHTLHGVERSFEHAAFLEWLTESLEREAVDALLITGDVFDSATPPVAAERTFYEFLAAARERRPELQVVVIGGNHDSPQRLEAARALLRPLGVHVVGRLPRRLAERAPGQAAPLDLERILIPLQGPEGAVAVWVAAVPFLRPADLPPGDGGPLLKAGDIYAEVLLAARGRRQEGQALIATAHCTIHGAAQDGVSERPIHGGDSLSADLFPPEVDYVAVGHVHKAQPIERETIRYAGSPLPLSFAEVDYVHECRLLEFEDGALTSQTALPVPRPVQLIRLPAEGPAPLHEVLPRLTALPARNPEEPNQARPFLEVRIAVEGPSPGLRDQVEAALEGRRPRLVKLEVARTQEPGEALADRSRGTHLREIEPKEVFRRCYAKAFPESEGPPADLEEAFAILLSEFQAANKPETDLDLARADQGSPDDAAPAPLFDAIAESAGEVPQPPVNNP
jgi:DNA repair protein SbcD/Mre11